MSDGLVARAPAKSDRAFVTLVTNADFALGAGALLRSLRLSGTGADLVVMQSHVPGLMDYIWPSNGGKVAGHAKCSVLVVRGD